MGIAISLVLNITNPVNIVTGFVKELSETKDKGL
jgi:malate/lactate dehydrogenase